MADDPRLEDPNSWGYPLNKLADVDTFREWRYRMKDLGLDATELLNGACRAHMKKYGVRSILPVVERIDDLSAFMEEFVEVDDK